MKTALRRRAVNQKRFRLFLLVFVAQTDVKLSQLFFIRRRSLCQQALCTLCLREGNHVTDGIGTAHHGDDTVKTEG